MHHRLYKPEELILQEHERELRGFVVGVHHGFRGTTVYVDVEQTTYSGFLPDQLELIGVEVGDEISIVVDKKDINTSNFFTNARTRYGKR